MQDVVYLIGLIATVIILASAAVSDIRTREIDDRHWIILGIVGTAVQTVCACNSPAYMVAGIIIDILLILYMFWSKTNGINGAMVLIIAAIIALLPWIKDTSDPIACRNVVTVVMFLSLLSMYRLGLIRGGADVKALMCISIAFPTYVTSYGLPLLWNTAPPVSFLFNPIIITLFVALLISMLYSVYTAVLNIRNGDWHRSMFSAYWVSINDARKSFVWPVIDTDGENISRIDSCDESEEIYDRLENAGYNRVLVTPMIPFLLPITIGFIITIVLGNPISAIL